MKSPTRRIKSTPGRGSNLGRRPIQNKPDPLKINSNPIKSDEGRAIALATMASQMLPIPNLDTLHRKPASSNPRPKKKPSTHRALQRVLGLPPNTVELIPTLGALSPRGGPAQDPFLTLSLVGSHELVDVRENLLLLYYFQA